MELPIEEKSKNEATDNYLESRRKLRMTPARNSIISGGNPYKEVSSSSKKFNSRTRHKLSSRKNANETFNETSNETFISCEQTLLFDRDSLEVGGEGGTHKYSSTPKILKELDHVAEQFQEVALEPQLTKQPTFLKDKNHNNQDNKVVVVPKAVEPTAIVEPKAIPTSRRSSPKKVSSFRKPSAQTRKSPPKKMSACPRKKASPKKTALMPPPPPAQDSRTNGTFSDKTRRQLFTPICSYRKPASLKSTASRYLCQWNNSRISRAQSFKSTAELERDYFRSLRSF